jgi:2-amino-4-hydroxy-6-hydroxymethyldihydropteridine diphosphokinase
MLETGLLLGSNLGDRLANLRAAAEAVASLPGVERIVRSAVYETEPVDVSPQHAGLRFLNAFLVAFTRAAPPELARRLHGIEAAMGRVRTGERNAPRPIDIDIVYAGSLVLKQPGLTVPHPEWNRRRFVVRPMADLRPWLRLPGERRTVREVLLSLPETPKVVLFTANWEAEGEPADG